MAENYCDYIAGDDDTGDGTAGDPYQTITKASIGLAGGDEVRVAKSAAPSALTGTCGFTKGSTAVTGAGSNFDPEVTIGDFIEGGDGEWYEVITVTDDTNLVLFRPYPSATGAGVDSRLLGITSTGAAAAAGTQIQSISVNGTSVASRLKISGGWDLTGPTQDGQTYFRQMHGTFANRWGIGLYASTRHWIEIERLHFLRYDQGLSMSTCRGWLITSMNILSSGDESLYMLLAIGNEFVSMVVNSSADKGIMMNFCHNNEISGIFNSHVGRGLHIENSFSNKCTDVTCNYNADGVFLYVGTKNIFSTLTCNNNTKGIYSQNATDNFVNNFSATGNGTDIDVDSGRHYGDYPIVSVQHSNAAGTNICYYEYGETYRDVVDDRSTQCLKYDPSSATIYISHSFYFVADSGVEQTLSAYVKDDAAFNGDIQAAIYFMGEKITGWSEWTPALAYAQKTIVAGAGDITEDGVLELRIKVRGTAGNVFVDDLATA